MPSKNAIPSVGALQSAIWGIDLHSSALSTFEESQCLARAANSTNSNIFLCSPVVRASQLCCTGISVIDGLVTVLGSQTCESFGFTPHLFWMPSQQVEVAEAITGIKRALKREREGIVICAISFFFVLKVALLMVPLRVQPRPINLWLPLQIEETSSSRVSNMFTKDP
jgi:hypothetical protein